MSATNEWTEWHLTPSGWVRGTEREDFVGLTERPTPDDRVLTMKYTSYSSSIYQPVESTWTELWRSPDEDEVNLLLEQFGRWNQRSS